MNSNSRYACSMPPSDTAKPKISACYWHFRWKSAAFWKRCLGWKTHQVKSRTTTPSLIITTQTNKLVILTTEGRKDLSFIERLALRHRWRRVERFTLDRSFAAMLLRMTCLLHSNIKEPVLAFRGTAPGADPTFVATGTPASVQAVWDEMQYSVVDIR